MNKATAAGGEGGGAGCEELHLLQRGQFQAHCRGGQFKHRVALCFFQVASCLSD